MSDPFQPEPLPAGGQTQRIAGMDRDAIVHDQLYRYAEDLQQMVERHGALEARYQNLQSSSDRLEKSRAMLDDLISKSPDIHLVTNTNGVILQCNPAAQAIAPTVHLIGSSFADWLLTEFRASFLTVCQNAAHTPLPLETSWEWRVQRHPASLGQIIVTARTLAFPLPGAPESLLWILRDITDQREAEFDTQISKMVFKNAAEAIMITDIRGDILSVNPAFTRITGYAAAEVIGRNPKLMNSGIQDEAFYANLWHALTTNGTWQGQIYNRKKNGEIFPEWLTISTAGDGNGTALSYIAVFYDLSNLQQTETQLAYLAHHDTVTGLPNRLLLEDRLSQTLAQSRRFGNSFSLVFIDLDRFKPVNDTYGHDIGDIVLRDSARRLKDSIREIDTLARFGGDEFVVLAPCLGGIQDISRFCTKLLDSLAGPFNANGHLIRIGASLGCASFPEHGSTEADLLRNADSAMYQAKAAGGNSYRIFDPAQSEPVTQVSGQEPL
jgi:diguanylate cyclase (GGDEF)-like protein/PAS domain S-box-containing protein